MRDTLDVLAPSPPASLGLLFTFFTLSWRMGIAVIDASLCIRKARLLAYALKGARVEALRALTLPADQ